MYFIILLQLGWNQNYGYWLYISLLFISLTLLSLVSLFVEPLHITSASYVGSMVSSLWGANLTFLWTTLSHMLSNTSFNLESQFEITLSWFLSCISTMWSDYEARKKTDPNARQPMELNHKPQMGRFLESIVMCMCSASSYMMEGSNISSTCPIKCINPPDTRYRE